MKTLMIASAAVLSLTGAALADSNAQFVADHFAMVESGDGEGLAPMLTNEDELISTKGNSLASIAAEKLFNGRDDER